MQVIAEQKQKATSKKLLVQHYILQGSLLACSSPLQQITLLFFYCFFLDIIHYISHFRAYKVIQTTPRCTIAYGDLYTNLPSLLYKLNSDSYVSQS